jgi:hypothetical protein
MKLTAKHLTGESSDLIVCDQHYILTKVLPGGGYAWCSIHDRTTVVNHIDSAPFASVVVAINYMKKYYSCIYDDFSVYSTHQLFFEDALSKGK